MSENEGERKLVHETIQGTFRQTNLTNEPTEYLGKREELRLAEIELMRQRERVAELRRRLPPGPALKGLQLHRRSRRLGFRRYTHANRPAERTVHRTGQVAGDLSPDVRETSDQAVPDVHRLDRRYKRSGSPHCPKRRLRGSRRSRSGRLASARPIPWVEPRCVC
jgi:hypothetical protein